MTTEPVTCPVCGVEQPALPRYPGYLCRACVTRAATADGRSLDLVNTSPSGGFAARYADSGELAEEESVTHTVYVDGVRCRAEESRVGGIVVRPEPDTEAPTDPREAAQ
ncbi:MAG TPA: hypothetical protein VFG63_11745 [Nocardioidaceae bacterium]|nr:hypothetical protein [Nocardioidaceae bacterium]